MLCCCEYCDKILNNKVFGYVCIAKAIYFLTLHFLYRKTSILRYWIVQPIIKEA